MIKHLISTATRMKIKAVMTHIASTANLAARNAK